MRCRRADSAPIARLPVSQSDFQVEPTGRGRVRKVHLTKALLFRQVLDGLCRYGTELPLYTSGIAKAPNRGTVRGCPAAFVLWDRCPGVVGPGADLRHSGDRMWVRLCFCLTLTVKR